MVAAYPSRPGSRALLAFIAEVPRTLEGRQGLRPDVRAVTVSAVRGRIAADREGGRGRNEERGREARRVLVPHGSAVAIGGTRWTLFWPSRVEARVPYESSFQHVAYRQAFGLTGSQSRAVPSRRPSPAVHPSAAFTTRREASFGAAMGA